MAASSATTVETQAPSSYADFLAADARDVDMTPSTLAQVPPAGPVPGAPRPQEGQEEQEDEDEEEDQDQDWVEVPPLRSGGGSEAGGAGDARARVEDVRMRFMWEDSGLLPLAAFRQLAQANPFRWSKPEEPAEFLRRLDLLSGRGRPLLVKVDAGEHAGVHRFATADAALGWLRATFRCEHGSGEEPQAENFREAAVPLGEGAEPGEAAAEPAEHLCVICLTEPVQIMLVPCRHAVLCEACLEAILKSSRPQCPICRNNIINHARGGFAQDYVDIVEALEARLERACASAYEGMYNRITPFMVTGALLGTGAVGAFVLAPAAVPLWVTLAAGSVCIGYVPWFATTAVQFEREDVGGTQLGRTRFLTREDLGQPLRLAAKLGLVAVIGPAAVVVFFVPYGIYAGLLRPLGRMLARGLVRGTAFNLVYLWRPLLRGARAAAAALGRAAAATGRAIAAVARAAYDYVLVPCWHGLEATGRHAVALAQELYENIILPAGRSIKDLAIGFYRHILCPSGEALKVVFRSLAECSASAVRSTYVHVLAPFGRLLAESLRLMGWGITKSAEALYEHALLPFARGVRKAAVFALDYVLVPVWERAIVPGTRLIFTTTSKLLWYGLYGTVKYVFIPILNGLSSLGAAMAEGARLTYEYVLLPCGQAAAAGLGLAHRYVVLPIGAAVAGAGYVLYHYVMVGGVRLTHRYVIVPVGAAVAGTGYVLYHYVMVPTWQATATGAEVVYSYVLVPTGTAASVAASTVYDQVLVPGGHAVYTAASTVGSGVQTCAAEVGGACRSVYEATRDAFHDLSAQFSRTRET